jgi:hypothetical protein
MSLLHRVTSFENLSPERGRSPTGSHSPRDRKLSFSPLPGSWVTVPEQSVAQPIGAFEVPKRTRVC